MRLGRRSRRWGRQGGNSLFHLGDQFRVHITASSQDMLLLKIPNRRLGVWSQFTVNFTGINAKLLH